MALESFLAAIIDSREQKNVKGAIQDSAFFNEIVQWIQFFDNRPSSFCHVIPTAFIFDYTQSDIIYISPSIRHLIGYDHKFFLDADGIVRFIDLINPNDFKIYNEKIFPKEMRMLNKIPHHEKKDLVFSTTLRLNQVNGNYKNLLMKKGFVFNEQTSLPLYEFGILLDISPIKKELSITHTIEKFEQNEDCSSYTKLSSEDYYPDMDANILSPREKEILINLSLGTKRKDVGEKLFISDNTVANHIKTILRKTNSKNIREAIAICKKNGII